MSLECPRPESNQGTRFRKPLLYPLSYGGDVAWLSGIRRSVIHPLSIVSGTLAIARLTR
jgi:hypothetical protein